MRNRNKQRDSKFSNQRVGFAMAELIAVVKMGSEFASQSPRDYHGAEPTLKGNSASDKMAAKTET